MRPSYDFRSDATYVIAGGLGGLGGAMVEWMADRNARHFLLLSRSGGDGNDTARSFIANMKARDVHIFAPKCDISNPEHVASAVTKCKAKMPPIRGCIQGAMVLRVSHRH
jgi:NAD(P)-dependent dehydrogenase (short-subunit alcohol dehydrogenase family)